MNSLQSHLDSSNLFLEHCVCGREFYTPGATSNHNCTCKRAKPRWFGALQKAQEVFRSAKRLKRSVESNGKLSTTFASKNASLSHPDPHELPGVPVVALAGLQSPTGSLIAAASVVRGFACIYTHLRSDNMSSRPLVKKCWTPHNLRLTLILKWWWVP